MIALNPCRGEVGKGVEDTAKALGKGYKLCYERLVVVRVDLTSHSFKDCCTDLAGGQEDRAEGNSRIDGEAQ